MRWLSACIFALVIWGQAVCFQWIFFLDRLSQAWIIFQSLTDSDTGDRHITSSLCDPCEASFTRPEGEESNYLLCGLGKGKILIILHNFETVPSFFNHSHKCAENSQVSLGSSLYKSCISGHADLVPSSGQLASLAFCSTFDVSAETDQDFYFNKQSYSIMIHKDKLMEDSKISFSKNQWRGNLKNKIVDHTMKRRQVKKEIIEGWNSKNL